MTLQIHTKSFHGVKRLQDEPVKCEICNYVFSAKRGLRKHIATVHGGKKPYKCKICDNSYTNNRSLISHIERVHNPKKSVYDCEYCNLSFNLVETLKIHHKKAHRIEIEIDAQDKDDLEDELFKRMEELDNQEIQACICVPNFLNVANDSYFF